MRRTLRSLSTSPASSDTTLEAADSPLKGSGDGGKSGGGRGKRRVKVSLSVDQQRSRDLATRLAGPGCGHLKSRVSGSSELTSSESEAELTDSLSRLALFRSLSKEQSFVEIIKPPY